MFLCVDAHAQTAPATQPAGPAVTITSAQLGNVFTAGQAIVWSIDIGVVHADSADWTVTDAWGVRLMHGTSPITQRTLSLFWPSLSPGYYELSVTAKAAGKSVAAGNARSAVLGAFDPQSVADSPLGVMSHFAQGWDTDLIPLIAKAGIKNVRDEVYWAHIESQKGQFNFTQFDGYMAGLAKNHLISLTPLDFGNVNYDRSPDGPDWCIAPYSEVGYSGYANYGAHVLQHYGPQIKAAEIWNEYNGSFSPGPANGKPEVYATMAEAAYPALKKVNPNVIVVGCGTSSIPLDWIEEVFKHGGLAAMDVVSVHPYSYGTGPEWIDTKMAALKSLIRKYNNGQDKPIWATEEGWFTTTPGQTAQSHGITQMTKARYLVRAYTIMMGSGVEKIFWYLMRDYDDFGTMGLVGKDDDPAGRYAPHQAYVAYAVMARQLANAAFVARDDTEPAIWSYHFDKPGTAERVIWSTEPRNVVIETSDPLVVTNLMGEPRTIAPLDGGVHIGLSESPIYVTGPVKSVKPDSAFSMRIPPNLAIGEPMHIEMSVPPSVLAKHPTITAGTVDNSQQVAFDLPPSDTRDERWTNYHADIDGQTVFIGSALTQALPPVMFRQFPHLVDLSTLDVIVNNISIFRPLQIKSIHCTIDQQHIDRDNAMTIQPSGSAEVKLPVANFKAWTIYPAKVEITFTDAPPLVWEGEISYNPVPRRTVAIDGDPSKWTNANCIDLAKAPFTKLMKSLTGDDADLTGNVYLSWDDANLYFAAKVRDPIFFQDQTGYGVWKGDNFQLGFHSEMPWPGVQVGIGSQELGLSLTPLGPQVFRFNGPGKGGLLEGIPLKIKRDGDITFYECAIPWSQLDPATPSRGYFSFALFLNDSDGQGRKGYKHWANIKDTTAFQACYLQK
jgi:Glycosyl hydrolase catalytic core